MLLADVFEKNPNTPLNKESINEIFSFDADAGRSIIFNGRLKIYGYANI